MVELADDFELRVTQLPSFEGFFAAHSDHGARIEAQLQRATLDRLGLESRSGTLISGNEKIEQAARRGQVRLLLHASDAGEDGRKKLAQAWRVGEDDEGNVRLSVGHVERRKGTWVPS